MTDSFDKWGTKIAPWESIATATAGNRRAVVNLEVFRHGETNRNADSRISGSAETDLTEHGKVQALEVGAHLTGHYDAAFQSPLRRCRETLSLALSKAHCDVRVAHTDPRLAERSMGVLEGKPSHPLPAYDAGDFTWAPPGGEPYISVTQRVLSFLLDLREAHPSEHQRVLVCTHVGPMRILIGLLRKLTDPAAVLTSGYPNAAIFRCNLEHLDWPPFIPRPASVR